MRKELLGLLLIGGLVGCTSQWDTDRAEASRSSTAANKAASALTPAKLVAERGSQRSFASLPDRGELLQYAQDRKAKKSGAYTYHPVSISEAHALNAIAKGGMHINMPDGKTLDLKYDRYEEQPDGNWTWIGRNADGSEAVLTFGDKAVFGMIASAGQSYDVSTDSAGAWIIETNRALLAAGGGHGRRREGPDYLAPPAVSALSGNGLIGAAAATGQKQAAISEKAGVNEKAVAIVDVLLGYSAGIVATVGSESGAQTRVASFVALTNNAYQASGVTMRLRLVHSMLVNYSDTGFKNDATLRRLTGYDETTQQNIAVDPAFTALRAAREQYGADLVALMRQYREPEQDGCGIAWLIGMNQRAISPTADASFGYAVVGDGTDRDESDNNTYKCSQYALAHELGHLMGQAHNTEDAAGRAGAHTYSYGYRETASTGFFTIMAYPRDDTQSANEIGNFANPAVSVSGRPTGTASADNVRSMNQTMPIIANFRSTVVPVQGQLDLFGIFKSGASNFTEVFAMNVETDFTQFRFGVTTGLYRAPNNKSWNFQFADFNGDGVSDLYVFLKNGASGFTEVHVLNGVGRYKTFLYSGTTPLGPTGSDNRWVFKVGNFNADAKPDIYAIQRVGASGRTEVHVLNGADNYKSFLANIATVLATTGTDYLWDFGIGDYNGDGVQDLFTIYKNGASGRTEVHILNGAGSFQSYLLNRGTALYPTGNSNIWNFKIGDYNLDGRPDIHAIYKQGASGKTEVFVMNGADQYQTYLAGVASALYATGLDFQWEFELAPPNR